MNTQTTSFYSHYCCFQTSERLVHNIVMKIIVIKQQLIVVYSYYKL